MLFRASGVGSPGVATDDRSESVGDIEQVLSRDPRFTIKKPSAANGKNGCNLARPIWSSKWIKPAGHFRIGSGTSRIAAKVELRAMPSRLALLHAEQPKSALPDVKHLEQPGSRYIDFLLPGMIGLGLMGGGCGASALSSSICASASC